VLGLQRVGGVDGLVSPVEIFIFGMSGHNSGKQTAAISISKLQSASGQGAARDYAVEYVLSVFRHIHHAISDCGFVLSIVAVHGLYKYQTDTWTASTSVGQGHYQHEVFVILGLGVLASIGLPIVRNHGFWSTTMPMEVIWMFQSIFPLAEEVTSQTQWYTQPHRRIKFWRDG
jgi:hypothetical protein